jgi:hypothetical protein
MKVSSLVFGGSALLALVIALAARTDVPQTVAATESAGQGSQFDDAWNDVASTVIFKTAARFSTEPKPVQTEVITPIPPVLVVSEEKVTKPKQHHVERDICQRHGMHKVYKGRSWRCRH